MVFSKSDTNVLYLHNYYSVRYKEHSGISEMILRFKEGDARAIDFFAKEMIEAMDDYYAGHMDYLSRMLVCIVPSHEKGKYSLGLVRLAKRICENYGLKNAVNLIQRTKTHERKSQGGNRDIEVMIDSLSLNPMIEIKGRNIIILDDVTTTGNSINAIRKILRENGAGQIVPQTLGKTREGTFKIDYMTDMPDFSVNIEIDKKKVPKDLNGTKTILKQYFGYDSFKRGQEEIIGTILSGGDALAIMPTGAGKSICYQLPALLLDGITIVVSPLISLMQDQVKALNTAGIHAAYINSSLNDGQITLVLNHARRGEYKIIYVAPERLENSEFIALSKGLRISMVSVDEAHCISQWGQDFRPSYLKIIQFIKSLKKRPIISAFTATATEEVKEDIVTALNLNDPKIVITGFNRENLYFVVETGIVKNDFILEYLEKHPGDSGIIYCSTRKNVESLYEILFKEGVSVTKYHAGLDSEERKNNQNDFIFDKALIMVATNAFGMGIDKSNVRFVIHYNMPQSMENYYQEAGRAGRDGGKTDCILLYSPQDVMTQKWLLDHKEFADIDPEDIDIIKERDARRLHVIENYCKTSGCLRNYILDYFGESASEPCENCGNCHREYKQIDMTSEAKCVANCIYETRGKYGLTIVSGTLAGARRARLREVGADKYKTYGVLKDIGEPMIKRLIAQMIQEEYLVQSDTRYSVLKLGPLIDKLKEPDTKVFVRYYEEKEIKKRKSYINKEINRDELAGSGNDLFEKLRALRLQIARVEAMPPYIVFSDKTIIQMCILLPENKSEMLRVSGVGEAKYEKYGERFIEIIRDYINRNTDMSSIADDDFDDTDEDTDYEEVLIFPKPVPDKPVKKEKKSKKVDFYLTEKEAEKFEYEEYLYVSDIRNRMNQIRNSLVCKVIRNKHIMKYLTDEGLYFEEYTNGVWTKRLSEKGREHGLILTKHKTTAGTEYYVLEISREVQKMIVQNSIRK